MKRKYAAIIIDPIYKVISGDENSAHEMAKFCNQFDRVCVELGAATIYSHHHSKGDQSGKQAHDRASGSGVFARDPDALLDCIELDITDGIRAQAVNRWECDAMSLAFDQVKADWRHHCPQDDALHADKLAQWAEANGLGDAVRETRPMAKWKAERASGWRIEGILREFPNFPARRVWFDYPTHPIDKHGLLIDALADGEQLPKKQRAEVVADNRQQSIKEIEDKYKELVQDGPVMIAELAEELATTPETVRNRIKKAEKLTFIRFKKGVVYMDGNCK